jgi:hypothetical protein
MSCPPVGVFNVRVYYEDQIRRVASIMLRSYDFLSEDEQSGYGGLAFRNRKLPVARASFSQCEDCKSNFLRLRSWMMRSASRRVFPRYVGPRSNFGSVFFAGTRNS